MISEYAEEEEDEGREETQQNKKLNNFRLYDLWTRGMGKAAYQRRSPIEARPGKVALPL